MVVIMSKKSNLKIGDVYGERTVIEANSSKDKYGGKLSMCRCSCGVEKEVHNYNLIKGKSKSCGYFVGKKLRDEFYKKIQVKI